MQSKNKRAKVFLLGIYIFVTVIYLLTCLVPFLNPGQFWFIALLGMGFPILLVLVLLCLIICAVLRCRWFILALAVLLISFQQISVVFGFHPAKQFNTAKNPNALRVLSWNVSSWREKYEGTGGMQNTDIRNLMIDAIQMQDADVLCFQEYFESFAPELFPSNISALQKMGFNYYYFTPVLKIVNEKLQSGLCIFSKYPILDSVFYEYKDGGNSEGYSYVDIRYNNSLIRIYNSHLQSPRLAGKEYNALEEIEESRTVVGKIKRGYSLRYKQAEILKQSIDTSKYPVIVCGDFNDVPNSYSYFKINSGLQDAFLKKGFGLGKTFQFISPTLRIDYIMADKQFRIEQFSKLDYKYSDHYAQIVDVSPK